MYRDSIISLLKEEMRPALGVTEPAAISLACAVVYQRLGGDLRRIELTLDPGVFKNAFSCGIPGTAESGIETAALLGVLAGEPDLSLEVLKNLREEHISRARQLKEKGFVSVEISKEDPGIFIKARVGTDRGDAETLIRDRHDKIVEVGVNGEQVFQKNADQASSGDRYNITSLNLEEIKTFVETAPFGDISFVLKAAEMNKALADAGKEGPGMGVGLGLERLVSAGKIAEDAVTTARILTARAVDARMGGIPRPAMSICGSGDHGIIAVMPLIALAGMYGFGDEPLARAIVLSYLVTIFIKQVSGRLSAFCGCAVAAGTGAAAGGAYLLGGGIEQIGGAIMNMAADITGIICDGGNYGCALKASTGAGSAVINALLAMEGVVIPEKSGIVGKTVEETMRNMGRIASPGMVQTNDTILDILR